MTKIRNFPFEKLVCVYNNPVNKIVEGIGIKKQLFIWAVIRLLFQ